ncbi:GNAT family N-acetyltransferase [Thaumasiovibrio subtropicus]|uniref:GNAT family N-acetyltransferase n=1 Tax=Thaumasiovibrio subtropicus TaxID=1891207 RepID=UPI000B34B377|nr:GNAT family N-acetyltransferase [Thaumasiovibrio subtropicus]
MIKLKPYTQQLHQDVVALKVSDHQNAFVIPVDEMLALREVDLSHHVIEYQDRNVGFFILDPHFKKRIPDATSWIGLRGFFIDQHHQGQGIAREALKVLPSYIKSHYTEFDSLGLTVNLRNLKAKQLYLKAGFTDTEQQYLGGPSGPQHVFKLPL